MQSAANLILQDRPDAGQQPSLRGQPWITARRVLLLSSSSRTSPARSPAARAYHGKQYAQRPRPPDFRCNSATVSSSSRVRPLPAFRSVAIRAIDSSSPFCKVMSRATRMYPVSLPASSRTAVSAPLAQNNDPSSRTRQLRYVCPARTASSSSPRLARCNLLSSKTQRIILSQRFQCQMSEIFCAPALQLSILPSASIVKITLSATLPTMSR